MYALALVAFYFGVGLYVAATTLFFVELATWERARSRVEWAPRLLGIGAACHLTHIVALSLSSNTCPLFSVESALSLAAFAAVAVFLMWRRREPISVLGTFATPPALASMIGVQVGAKGPLLGEYSPGVLAVHVASSLIGLALFLLAGGAGIYYLVAERRLKSKRPGHTSGKLPPLEVLDRVEHRFLLAGFPLLTIGLVFATFFGGSWISATGPEVARSLLAYGSWIIMALVLLMRSLAGWRGKRAAYGTLAGVILMLLVIAIYLGASNAQSSGGTSAISAVPHDGRADRLIGTEVSS